jgi:hypothetical protein
MAQNIKTQLADAYLEFVNDYLTHERYAEHHAMTVENTLKLLRLGKIFHEERVKEEVFFTPKAGDRYRVNLIVKPKSSAGIYWGYALADTDKVVERKSYGTMQPQVCYARLENVVVKTNLDTGESERSVHDTSMWAAVRDTHHGKQIIVNPCSPYEAALLASYLGPRIDDQSFWRYWLPCLEVVTTETENQNV